MRTSESIHSDTDTKTALHHIEDAAADQETIQPKQRTKRIILLSVIALAITVAVVIGIAVPLSLKKHTNDQSGSIHSTSIGGSTSDTTAKTDATDDENVYKAATLVTAAEQAYNPPAYAHAVSPYANLIRLKTYTPASDNQRIFVMGDIHGCLKEMNQLLDKIQFQPKHDVLILTGDLVYRGEDSLGVIRRANELGALCVRGNHDDKVVRFKTFEIEHGAGGPSEETMPEGQVGDPLKFKNKHSALAREMSMDEYNYLADCPLILDIPELHARVVHGGLDPAITNIIDNDPWSVMNMRLIDGDNKPSKEKLKENPDEDARNWTTAYAEESKDNVTVYYGHDASRGATIGSKTIGLDSGCVYGRQLSVMEMKSQELTQIDCTDRSAEDHDD